MSDDLFRAARAAIKYSHAPYSQFPVGAAIRTRSGNIYSGCNIENASYPEGWCAETTAISHMIMGGETDIAEILVCAEKMDMITPCGGCRQRISEFAKPDVPVHLCNQNGIIETFTVAQLLPAGFDLKDQK